MKLHYNRYLKNAFFLAFLILASSLWGQGGAFPVQIIPQVTPPPPIYLSHYADGSSINSPLRVQIILNDLNIQNREVRLKTYFQGGGLSFQSNDFVTGSSSLFLEGGVPLILTNVELAPYFKFENITGISPNVYGNAIPEGTYQICFEVYDLATGNRLSNKSCATTVVFQNEPPFLISPRNKTNIAERNPQNIVFQWTPRSINVTNVEYELSLVEIWDTQIDPQAAFLSSPPIFQTTTTATTYVFGPSDPLLLSGKNYAWRIQAKAKQGTEEIGLFKNQGYSEIFSFSHASACDLPLGINHDVKGSTNANIFWDDFSTDVPEYTVRYRKSSSPSGESEGEWFYNKTTSNLTTLWDLKANTEYEYQIQKKCAITTSNWSITKEFTTALELEEESLISCGITPNISLENMEPLSNIANGGSFKAGDFPVTILEVSGSNGRFTGKGYVALPYLKNIKVAVTFTNILINTDKEMAEGTVETVYDAKWGNILDTEDVYDVVEDIGDVFSGGENNEAIKVDFVIPSEDSIKIIDGEIVVTGPNGEKSTFDHDTKDSYVITDAAGNQYTIDKDGNITQGGLGAPGGTATAENTSGINTTGTGTVASPSVESLTADGIAITFKVSDSTRYGFDFADSAFEKSRYHKVTNADGTEFYPIHKAVVEGESDNFIAEIGITNPTIVIDSLIFKTVSGTKIDTKKVDDSTISIAITGTNSYHAEEAIVTYKDSDGKYKIAASFFIHHIKKHEEINVVLVSVNGTAIPENIENQLNTIYNTAGANFKIANESLSLVPADWEEGTANGIIDYSGSGLLSDYPEELKNIQQKYKQSNLNWNASAYHLFLLPSDMPVSKSLSGFMPKTRQWGYIFNAESDNNENALENKPTQILTAAHELGHGVFALAHPFQDDENTSGSDTNWLMDYRDGNQLSYADWAMMSDESLKLYLFQDDEDGEAQESLKEYIASKMQALGNSLNSKIITILHCEDCENDINTSYKIEPEPINNYENKITYKGSDLILQDSEKVIKKGSTCLVLYYTDSSVSGSSNSEDNVHLNSFFGDDGEGVWIYDEVDYKYDCSNEPRPWASVICNSLEDELVINTYLTNLFDYISNCEPPFKELLVEKLKESKLEYNIYSKGMESWVNDDDLLEMVFDYTANNLVIKKEDFTEKIEEFLKTIDLPSTNEAIYFAITDATTSRDTLDSFYLKGSDLDINLIEGDLQITHIEIKLGALGQINIIENENIANLKKRTTSFEKRYNSIFHESIITLENYQEDIAKRYVTNFMSTFERDGLKENLSDSDYSNIFDNGILSTEATIDIINKYLESEYAEAIKVDVIDSQGLHLDDNVNGEKDIIFLINQIVATKSKTEATKMYDAIFPSDSYDNGLLKKFVNQFSGVDVFVADGNYEKISKEIRDLWIKVNPQYEANADFIASLQETNKIFPLGIDGAFASDQESCTMHFLSPEYGQYDIEVSLPKGERIATQTYNGINAITTYHCDTENYTVKIDNYAEPVGLYLTSPVNINGKDFKKGETIIVPAYMLFQIKDEQLNKRIATYVEVGADVALTFTGIGNLTKIRHLTKVQKAVAIYEVASSSLDVSARIGTEFLQKNDKLSPTEAANITNVTGTLAGLAGVAEIGYKGRQLFLNYIETSDDFTKAAADFNRVKNDLDITSQQYIDLSKAFNATDAVEDLFSSFSHLKFLPDEIKNIILSKNWDNLILNKLNADLAKYEDLLLNLINRPELIKSWEILVNNPILRKELTNLDNLADILNKFPNDQEKILNALSNSDSKAKFLQELNNASPPVNIDNFLKNLNTSTPPNYIGLAEDLKHSSSDEMVRLIAKRAEAKKNADALAINPGIDSDAYKIAKNKIALASEDIGLQAGIDYMAKNFDKFTNVSDIGKGRGKFDLIFQNGDQFIIIEAKGGINSGKLGSKIVNDIRVSQGTREYMTGILEDMGSTNLVDDIQFSLDNKEVRYLLIDQIIKSDGQLNYTVIKEFNIYGN